jgi:hypothetical protein
MAKHSGKRERRTKKSKKWEERETQQLECLIKWGR